MKAVQIQARGKPTLIDTPVPELQAGHALIKTQRVSLCGSDIRWLHHLADADYPTAPGTTGHEMVGIIEAVDDDSGAFAVGDRVLALAPDHRAMATYYLAQLHNLIKLPQGIAPEMLVQAQQLGTVRYACKQLGDISGQRVAIIGQGSAGLWFDVTLREMGIGRIIGIDLEENRLAAARYYGVDATLHNRGGDLAAQLRDLNDGDLPDMVIEAAGEADTIALAVELVRDYGRILYFGVPRMQMVDFPINDFFFKNLSAQAVVYATREANHQSTREAVQMIAEGTVDVEPIITHSIPFKDVLAAYEMHRTRADNAIKIVVNMEG